MVDISVIIPVYNVEKFLPRCLGTVLDQTFTGDYEVICVNDGSTDNSGSVLEDFARNNNKIKVITQHNQGLSEARNSGVKVATGEYVLFVDSDDFIAKNTLECLYNCAKKHNSDVVIFDHYTGTPDLKDVENFQLTNIAEKYGEETFNAESAEPFVYRFVPVAAWAKLYRLDLIKDIKFEKGLYYEDVPYWDIVYTSAKRINYIPVPYYYYTVIRENAIMSNNDERVFHIFKSFDLSRKILKSKGYYEKFKNIFYAHLVCNIVMHLQTIKSDLRKKYIGEIKKIEFDVDYNQYEQEDFYPFEKDNMQIVRYIKEHDYDTICAYMKEKALW